MSYQAWIMLQHITEFWLTASGTFAILFILYQIPQVKRFINK